MLHRSLSFRVTLLLLFLCCAPAAFAQQAQHQDTSSLNYGFVSPNTREGLVLDEAIKSLGSTEESELLGRIHTLRCVVRRPISTRRALGTWTDGAEHSILLRVNSNESTMRYLMSRLGKDANQKAVLYFHQTGNGNARLYVIHPSKTFRNLARIGQLLDREGIAFRTLVPTRNETTVYVTDTENALAAKVRHAAMRLRARFNTQRGSASFIGNDSSREDAQATFDKEIKSYESDHPNLPPACQSN